MAKEKRFFVDFEFKTQVNGFVYAKSAKEAKAKVLNCSNPSFDEMVEYNQSSDPDIEFETVMEDDV